MHTTYVYDDGKVRRAMKAHIISISEQEAVIRFDNEWSDTEEYAGVHDLVFYRVPAGMASSDDAYYHGTTNVWYYLHRDTEEYLLHLKDIYPEQTFNRLFGEH